MSRTSLRDGQVIISLPETCLLTTDTVMKSYLGAYIARWRPPLSPVLALCTFLVSEKHAGERSPWKPYLDTLPSAYSCPVCLEPEVVALLPEPLRAQAAEQRARVWGMFAAARAFFSSLQPLFPQEATESVFSPGAFLWAWCTVNTRAVYLRQRPGDCSALAPFLDLLNHSPHVQVHAAFNEDTRRYEISAARGCGRGEEVFICYGPHDNRRLLLEYGFVAARNPHASVPVTLDTLVKYLPSADKQMNKKVSILRDHNLTEDLTFGWDGPSWRLLTALKLLCLRAGEFTCWKKVLLGETISDANEKMSLDVAQKVCRCLLEESTAGLRKVSGKKDGDAALTSQLTLVEALWTEELEMLQASAETLSGLQAALSPS